MMKKITVNLKDKSYPILIQRGLLNQIGQVLDGQRKVMIITDEGVPEEYAQRVLAQCSQGYVERVIQGEGAKSMEVYQQILRRLLKERFSRKDLIVALGGGVIGDLSGLSRLPICEVGTSIFQRQRFPGGQQYRRQSCN
ncbi:MAG: iron-containing alcohol dehydrogenase [Holdemania massiliensis]